MTAELHFRSVVPKFMRLFMADFSATELDAAAVFGNFGHESLGLTALQEFKPTVKGSKGGWGWAQWTGPRRKAFEAYCKRTGRDPAADQTNYDYVFVELNSTHASAVGALKRAKTLESKVVAFEKQYEGAGVKHYPERQKWAAIALDALRKDTPTPQGAPMSNRPILDAIKAGTTVVLKREHVDVDAGDVKPVTDEIIAEVAPRIKNATNSEKPWQSRIFIGLGTLALGFIANKLNWTLDTSTDFQFWADLGTQALQIWGTGYAAYGRMVGATKKPLGAE